MDPSGKSYAAVSAIKAMQKQLKTLEAENFELKREKKRLLKLSQVKTQELNERKQRLLEKTNNAKQMIKAASVALSQISDVRSEVEYLKAKNQKIEELLHKEKEKGESIEEQIFSLKTDLATNDQRLSAYQSFIGEFLKPPQPPTAIGINEFVAISSDDDNVNELNPELLELYNKLSSYPKKFQAQNLEMKKNILKAFCEAQKATNELSSRILASEQQRYMISSKDMSPATIHLYKEFFALSNEMKKFTFV